VSISFRALVKKEVVQPCVLSIADGAERGIIVLGSILFVGVTRRAIKGEAILSPLAQRSSARDQALCCPTPYGGDDRTSSASAHPSHTERPEG
jgi:hypothetical protein